MKLKLGQLREWLDAHYRGEITYGKVVQNINEFFNPDLPMEAYQYVSDTKKPQRLTAEEMLNEFPSKYDTVEQFPDEDFFFESEVLDFAQAFARQEVEAKEREWREKIQKQIELTETAQYASVDKVGYQNQIYALQELLKGG